MAAAMCQALPSFFSDYSNKSLFISVSNELYENYIVTNFHIILTGTSLSQILPKHISRNCLSLHFEQTQILSSIVISSGEVFNQLICKIQHNLR